MNTSQIERLFENEPLFRGVYSSDNLPDKPGLLICNTDPSTKPGEHWISIYVDESSGRGEYFDSFGRMPNEHFKLYMDTKCRIWTFNERQLQSVVTSLCGYYCCLYCKLKCRGWNMAKIVNLFTKDTGLNDSIVYRFLFNKRNKM
jgi:hypothetical protein